MRSNELKSQIRDETSYALLGAISVAMGLIMAVAVMPVDPRPAGAMFWPALLLALGLSAVPVVRLRRSVKSIVHPINLLMAALIYWILLDPIQSAYPLDRVSYDSVVTAMTAIATMAIGIWLGTAGKGFQLPKAILRSAQLPLQDSTLVVAILCCFGLGMLHFALSCDFDFFLMIKSLSVSRFAAPWSRGSLGGWDSFSEQMTYFGYVLPSLTVLLAIRKGWLQRSVVFSVALSLVMPDLNSKTGFVLASV